jgi:uncharacterized membrane protein YccF (DUF307 family)
MRTVLNVIWLLLCGVWMALGYLLAALIMAVLIVTLPFAKQSLKLAGFAFWPFGRTAVKNAGHSGVSTLGNVLWVLFCGWWLVLGHIVTAFFQAVTVIGLPLAYANVKMIPMTLAPFGRDIVKTSELARISEGAIVVSAEEYASLTAGADPEPPRLPSGGAF